MSLFYKSTYKKRKGRRGVEDKEAYLEWKDGTKVDAGEMWGTQVDAGEMWVATCESVLEGEAKASVQRGVWCRGRAKLFASWLLVQKSQHRG